MVARVIVNGASGKMGALACATLEKHPEFDLVAKLNRQDDLRSSIINTQADIVIDLTRADVVYQNTLTIIECGAHPVIGTSGLLPEQIQHLDNQCKAKQLGAIIAPNFSIAAVLMMNFAAQAARFLPCAEIIEMHHEQKYDAPSGTAMKSADLIASQRQKMPAALNVHELVPGVLGGKHKDIPIHSLRLPGVVANQQIIFGSVGETLTLQHNTIDRSCFMPGIVLCCQTVQTMNRLVYGLEHLLTPT